MIKVLIVEDSPVVSELIRHILDSDDQIKVIGIASNGQEALDFLKHTTPDLITMDINMPKMGGLETIRIIMSTNPVPIVIVSSDWSAEDIEVSFKAMEVGAVSVAEKPWGATTEEFDERANKLIKCVKAMSEIKLITRRNKPREILNNFLPVPDTKINMPYKANKTIKLIVIGASTGGPPVLQTILTKLPKDFPVPVMVVQHIAIGFLQGFVDLLNNSCNLKVSIAQNNQEMLPGNIYFAPDLFQTKINEKKEVILTNDALENGVKPSVSYLFKSVAKSFGKDAMGILLTGMGRDGADGLLEMREKGAVTIAQNKETSVVHGMPGVAISIGAVEYILGPDEIAGMLQLLVKGSTIV